MNLELSMGLVDKVKNGTYLVERAEIGTFNREDTKVNLLLIAKKEKEKITEKSEQEYVAEKVVSFSSADDPLEHDLFGFFHSTQLSFQYFMFPFTFSIGWNYTQIDETNRELFRLKAFYPKGSLLVNYGKMRTDKGVSDLGVITAYVCILALEQLHHNMLYHMDIKPTNILFDKDYIPYVDDSGYARAYNEKDLFSSFIAPECKDITGDKLADMFTFASDIYSLGVIFYSIFIEVSIPQTINRYKIPKEGKINILINKMLLEKDRPTIDEIKKEFISEYKSKLKRIDNIIIQPDKQMSELLKDLSKIQKPEYLTNLNLSEITGELKQQELRIKMQLNEFERLNSVHLIQNQLFDETDLDMIYNIFKGISPPFEEANKPSVLKYYYDNLGALGLIFSEDCSMHSMTLAALCLSYAGNKASVSAAVHFRELCQKYVISYQNPNGYIGKNEDGYFLLPEPKEKTREYYEALELYGVIHSPNDNLDFLKRFPSSYEDDMPVFAGAFISYRHHSTESDMQEKMKNIYEKHRSNIPMAICCAIAQIGKDEDQSQQIQEIGNFLQKEPFNFVKFEPVWPIFEKTNM